MESQYILVFVIAIVLIFLFMGNKTEYYEDRYDYRLNCGCCGRYNCKCPYRG